MPPPGAAGSGPTCTRAPSATWGAERSGGARGPPAGQDAVLEPRGRCAVCCRRKLGILAAKTPQQVPGGRTLGSVDEGAAASLGAELTGGPARSCGGPCGPCGLFLAVVLVCFCASAERGATLSSRAVQKRACSTRPGREQRCGLPGLGAFVPTGDGARLLVALPDGHCERKCWVSIWVPEAEDRAVCPCNDRTAQRAAGAACRTGPLSASRHPPAAQPRPAG